MNQLFDGGYVKEDIRSVVLTGFRISGPISLTSVFRSLSIYVDVVGEEPAPLGEVPVSVLDDEEVDVFEMEMTELEIADVFLTPGGLSLVGDGVARSSGNANTLTYEPTLRVGYN